MKRGLKPIFGNAVVGLLGTLAVLYVGDWAVWRTRIAMGGGMGTVTVSTMTALAMKDGKEAYYWDGTADVGCSRSIFPQAGSGACWWLTRHNIVYEH